MKRMSLASLLNLKKVLTAICLLLVTAAFLNAQTTFTATASGNWSEITWTKTGPSLANYPGEPGYESEIHDVEINGAGIIVTLDLDITSSIRNIALTTGTLDISSATLTMTGDLSGGSTLTFSSGRVNIAGNNNSSGIFNTGIGSVNYNGVNQTVRGTTYYDLEISGSGIKAISAHTIISNNLTIYAGQLETANRNFSVNNGTTTIFSGGELTANSTTGNKSFRNVILSGGTITSTSATAETMNISGTLICNNNSASTLGNITTLITGSATVTAGSTLSFGQQGTKTFEGQVIVNGSWENSANEDISFRNGLTVNGTSFISGTGTYTFSNNSQSIQGSLPITFDGAVSVGTMTLTNSANVTIKGTLTGGNPSTWRNASGSVLNYENAAAPMDGANRTLNASANSNRVNYSGAGDQAVKGATYFNLITSVSGTKTLQAAATVNGNLSVTGSTSLVTNQYQITGNATGSLTLEPGTSLLLGNPSSATTVSFPTNFVTANISLDPTSTVIYQANTSQTISAAPVYGNLSTATTGAKTLANNITVLGDLSIGTGTTLSSGAGNFDISLAGSWMSNGSYTENQGKVLFNGTGAQSITNTLTGTETFYDLEFNSAGPVTSACNLAAINNLTMTQGVILMPGRSFLLGTGAATPGTLTYSAGWISGTFSRWAAPVHNGAYLLFPVGDNSLGRNFSLNFSAISAAGILSVDFVPTTPSVSGLPLFEDLYVINVLFPEGYWRLAKDALFAFSGTYDLDLVPTGFSTYPIDANTRILSQVTPSGWSLNGTHAPGSSALLHRTGLTSFMNEYAVAPADICTPSLTGCPGDVVINNAPGTCGNTATWTAPVMDIACPGFTITNNFNPGDNFNIGATQVAYYIMKGTARIDSCKFNVVVNDNELPVVLCRNTTLYLDASGSAILTVAAIDNGSSDNCSLVLAADRVNFSCSDAGLTIPVQLTGTDPSGNTTSCTAQVTVLDNISPVISLKTTTLELDATGNAILPVSAVDNGTSDNCLLDTIYVTPNSFTCADLGPQTVTLHAIDIHGNTSSAAVVITVKSSLKINSTSLSNCDLAGTYALYKANVSGGDGNYTYLWDGLDDSVDPFVTITGTFPFLVFSNTSTLETPFFNNLMPDGTYTIRLTVTDQGGSGCSFSEDMIIVKTGLVFNNVTVRYSDACEGSVMTYSVTEDPDATYNWGVQNGTILTSPLDTSKIEVRWNVGVSRGIVIATSQKINIIGDPCESTVVDTVAINPLPNPAFNPHASDVCYNSLVTYNLTQPYSDYSWTVSGGTITAGGNGFDYVTVRWGTGPAGRVTALVGTAAGCSASIYTDINIYNLAGTITSLTNVTCNGANDGQVTVTATAGSGVAPYFYRLDGNPFVASGTFTGIAPGNHIVTIRDALGCTFDITFTISQPPVLSASVTAVNIACFGGSTGSITATAAGGTPPYEYSLDGGAYLATGTFTGLTAGNHLLAIRDSKLCPYSQNINLSQPAAALAASVSITDVACFGESTGAVNLAVTGGTIPYSFIWTNGATTEDITGLAAGTYSVTITDANLCTTNTSATISQPAALVASAFNSGPVCIGDPISLTGGPIGMTTYAWTGPDGFTSSLQSPLISAAATLAMNGVYTLTVTNAAGCSDTETTTVTVTPENSINLSSAVGTDNQSICINESLVTINYITTGATNATFLNLPPGVTGSWAANLVTISGTPTVSGSYTYTVTLTGGCGTSTANGTIDVAPENTINLISAAGTDDQTVCINTPITPIVYSTAGAIGANFTGLPDGMTVSWAFNNVTISGSPSISGTFNYIINLLGGCGAVSETGTITVTPNNTVSLSSAPGTNAQTVCVNTAINLISYTTNGATGATVTGLPSGVTGVWAGDVVTISGTPSESGNFSYTVSLEGGCGTVTAPGSIIVTPDNNIALTSAAGTDGQSVCINTAITDITYSTTGASGASVTGLPSGVTAIWAANVLTISGTPDVPGSFTYTVDLTGGCGTVSTTGSVIVNADNTISLTSGPGSDSQTICINTALAGITYATTSATGATVTGLPSGVTGTWAGDVVTISGTPSESGTFSYTVSLEGGCGTVTAPGSIIVTPDNDITLTSAAGTDGQTVCINTAITDITYATTGASGASVTGLPSGVTALWAADILTISGTPDVPGAFTYTVDLTGGCGTVSTTGSVTVNGTNTLSLTSGPGSDAQTICINTALAGITYATTSATGATVTGLPSGVTGTWAGDVVTISGTPSESGTFSYTVSLEGGCGTVSTTGSITVTPDNIITLTSGPGTDDQTICNDDPITPIVYTTTGATGYDLTGLPAGMTVTWLTNVVTISGIPAAPGVFNYKMDLTGGCGSVSVTGTITVLPDNIISLTSGAGTNNQTLCINTALPEITFTTTGATGATVTGLPGGVNGTWAANVVTISGTPSEPGTFNYTVALTGGCGTISAAGTIIVTPDNTITLTSAAGTDAQTVCPGAPITDIIYTTTGATGATVTGLPAGLAGTWAGDVVTIAGTPSESGIFSYTIALSGGCGIVSKGGTINITAPLSVSVTITADANPVCAGATVNFTAAPINQGLAPVYQWQVNGVDAGIDNIAFSYVPVNNDTVTVILTSSEGCTIANPDTSAPVVMIVNDLPAGSLAKTDVACFGAATGAVDLTMTAGLLPMTYGWSNGEETEDITGVAAGVYTVTITDANSCTLILSETVSEPASAVSGAITSQADVTTIGGNDGSVTVDGSGGTPPYMYSLNGGTFQAAGTFSALTAGIYTVTVQDFNLCTFDVPVLIRQPFLPLDGTVTSQTDALCYGEATGTVTVQGIEGAVPYEYSLNGGAYQSSGTFGLLTAGSYTVTIRDLYSNLFDVPVTIGQPGAALTVTTSKDDVNCNGGSDGMASVLPAGGTGAYTFSWNTTPVQTADTARNLSPGTYTVNVSDANGCSAAGEVTIAEPAELTVETSSTLAKCPDSNDGSVTLDISGGTEPYSVIWENSDETTTSRNNLLPGTYNVVVTDANLCPAGASEEVGFIGTFDCVVIPDLITPDPADGYNDEWIIRNIHIYPQAEIKIYSRWGKLIYHSKNPSAEPWKGRYANGTLVPTDSYRYILDLHDGSKLRSGVISVIR